MKVLMQLTIPSLPSRGILGLADLRHLWARRTLFARTIKDATCGELTVKALEPSALATLDFTPPFRRVSVVPALKPR